jgi:hypothetical protein
MKEVSVSGWEFGMGGVALGEFDGLELLSRT